MPTIAILCRKAVIGNPITDREMVDHLSLLGREVEIAVHLFVIKRANAGCRQPEGFRREIEPVADNACFKMHITITTITMGADGTAEIADHREGDACVTREILPKAQTGGGEALVATPDLLQLSTIRPQPVYTRRQIIDTMGVQIELDKRCTDEIRREWPACDREDCRELRQRHRVHSAALEVERRTPPSGYFAKGSLR